MKSTEVAQESQLLVPSRLREISSLSPASQSATSSTRQSQARGPSSAPARTPPPAASRGWAASCAFPPAPRPAQRRRRRSPPAVASQAGWSTCPRLLPPPPKQHLSHGMNAGAFRMRARPERHEKEALAHCHVGELRNHSAAACREGSCSGGIMHQHTLHASRHRNRRSCEVDSSHISFAHRNRA
jgi:hypothetical protein